MICYNVFCPQYSNDVKELGDVEILLLLYLKNYPSCGPVSEVYGFDLIRLNPIWIESQLGYFKIKLSSWRTKFELTLKEPGWNAIDSNESKF